MLRIFAKLFFNKRGVSISIYRRQGDRFLKKKSKRLLFILCRVRCKAVFTNIAHVRQIARRENEI